MSSSSNHPARRPVSAVTVSLVAAALCAWTVLPAQAALISIEIAPPPPRHEVVPRPRRGYIWAPGYWARRGSRFVWTKGHWERNRPGHHYVPGRWVGHGKHYTFEAGHWS